MLRAEPQECPRCGGTIEQCDAAWVHSGDRVDRFLHCDFCGYGIESSQYSHGSVFTLDFQRTTEPVNYGKFRQRLESARVA